MPLKDETAYYLKKKQQLEGIEEIKAWVSSFFAL